MGKLLNKLIVIILIFILNLAFTNCADESYDSKSNTDAPISPYLVDREKLSAINNKYLFLEEYFNEKGEKEFKEPYHYHFSFDAAILAKKIKGYFEFSMGIRVPSADCNLNYNQCNEENGIFSCSTLTTLVGCLYRNDLSQYYLFPEKFTVNLEDGFVIVKNTKNLSRAKFKIFNSKEELPAFKEPPRIANE